MRVLVQSLGHHGEWSTGMHWAGSTFEESIRERIPVDCNASSQQRTVGYVKSQNVSDCNVWLHVERRVCGTYMDRMALFVVRTKFRFHLQGKLSFIVNNTKYKWSQVFKLLQEFLVRFTNIVYDISVLETSLEDIFLQIARKSTDTEINSCV